MKKLENEQVIDLLEDSNKQISMIKTNDEVYIRKEFYHHNYQNVYTKIMQNPHKNICEIFKVDRNDSGFTVMEEYLGSQTLLDVSPIQCIDEGYQIIFQLCEGIKHLHKLNIVHRDLKPENIYYINGRVVINDFDISKTITKRKDIVQDTEVLGSVGYASPEQYGFSRSDERADIYSIGIVINVLFSGHFINEHVVEGSLGDVVKRCTEIHMDDRYQSITELEKALRVAQLNVSKYRLPGFRTKKISTKILSTIGYLLILIFLFLIKPENNNSFTDIILIKIIGFEAVILPILIAANYLNIKSLLPRQLRNIKFIGSFVLWVFLFTLGALVFSFIFSFFK